MHVAGRPHTPVGWSFNPNGMHCMMFLLQCALSHLALLLPPSKTRSPGHHGAPIPRGNCIWCLPRREEQLTPAGHVMGLSEGWSFEEMTDSSGSHTIGYLVTLWRTSGSESNWPPLSVWHLDVPTCFKASPARIGSC